jgi:uncharacterized membrane protein
MSRRTLLIVLFASLALNLFAIGAIAGAGLTGWRPHGFGGGAPPRGGGMGSVGRVLSPEHREEWRTLLRAQATGSGAQLRQARMLRRGAWMRFATDPMDAPGILADLEKSRDLEAQGRAALDQQIVSFAATLPADERVKFANALLQPRGAAQSGGWLGGGRPHQPKAGLADR